MKANNIQKFLIALTLITLTTTFSTIYAADNAVYKFREFSLGKKSWEEFNTSFNIINLISGNSHIQPEDYKIEMISEDGTVLKTIHNKNEFSIDDKNLGSKEKLTFRISAKVKGEIVTAEVVDFASQKSVVVDNDVNLPLENHISLGDVKIACKLMRTKFSNPTKLEVIGSFSDVAVSLFISNSDVNDYVEVPLNKQTTNFDLAQYKYFDDLKMQMERDLRKTNTAVIKYYFQFVWDRNVYIVDGGSKNINVKSDENLAVVKNYSRDLQKLVTTNTYNKPEVISASAE